MCISEMIGSRSDAKANAASEAVSSPQSNLVLSFTTSASVGWILFGDAITADPPPSPAPSGVEPAHFDWLIFAPLLLLFIVAAAMKKRR